MAEKKKTLQGKMDELEQKVNWFYGDEFNLDQATDKYRETMKLAKEIDEDLNTLSNEVEIIEKDFSLEDEDEEF